MIDLDSGFHFRFEFVCFLFFDLMFCLIWWLAWRFVWFWKGIGVGCGQISIWAVDPRTRQNHWTPKIQFASAKNRNTTEFASSCSLKMCLSI